MKMENKLNILETITKIKNCSIEIKILYVEDDVSVREPTAELLSNIFESITTANNGKEGLETYKNGSFDIVISDILMPKMNGVTLIEKIKEINPSQSVIITSACDDSTYLLDLINLGVSSFILKPIQSEQFLNILLDMITNLENAASVKKMNEDTKQELVHQSAILEQYKEIVDASMIVSKTDTKGIITYVNDEFCKISKYDRSELIGNNHNIVRHPDMSAETYRNLWKTILNKNIWQGVVKNKKKNGDYYITDTIVKPILDEHNNIIEHISIRHDITQIYDLNEEIWSTQHEMISLLGEIGETRSQETGNHVRRVAKYSRLLAELYGLDKDETNYLYIGSPMHDIGKIGIPDSILLKPAKLTEEEYTVMRTHANIGYEILKKSDRPILKAASIISYEHHEKWNGSGYPRALEGEEIHIYGRITALADVFDALSCKRVYKKSWPMEDILEYIKSERGKHFDPNLVDLFFENIDQFIEISKEHS